MADRPGPFDLRIVLYTVYRKFILPGKSVFHATRPYNVDPGFISMFVPSFEIRATAVDLPPSSTTSHCISMDGSVAESGLV